jgi:uncharacterized protein YndB with AHSA1/START domain
MTYDLKIERLLDAPPELVFDTILDPSAAREIYGGSIEGWSLRRFDIDLRIGGEWTFESGPTEGEVPADLATHVFTEIDRPRRLAYDVTMFVSGWGRTVRFQEAITLEDQDGKTLLTIVLSGLESEADRDGFAGGVPSFVESVKRVAEARAREGHAVMSPPVIEPGSSERGER